jgi:hypothetical protein
VRLTVPDRGKRKMEVSEISSSVAYCVLKHVNLSMNVLILYRQIKL